MLRKVVDLRTGETFTYSTFVGAWRWTRCAVKMYYTSLLDMMYYMGVRNARVVDRMMSQSATGDILSE